jgi:hypothetical protein
MCPFYRSVLAADEGPRRFVIFVEGNGIEPHNFLPSATRSALESAGAGSLDGVRHTYRQYGHDSPVVTQQAGLSDAPSLGSLAADGDAVSLEEKAAVVLGLSSKIAGGGHSTGVGALCSTPGGIPTGPSIDHYLSNISAVRRETPFQAVRLGVVGDNTRLNYSTCALGPEAPAPITCDPTSAFNSLFGSVAEGAGRRAFNERRELLDFAINDVDRALRNFSGNSREREKLERYLESLETMVGRQAQIRDMEDQIAAVKPGEPGEVPLYTSDAPLDRLQAQVDLATSALIGGLTNVIVISLGTGGRYFSMKYPSLSHLYPDGDIIGGHQLRHTAEDGAQPFVDMLTAITDRHVAMMASMARSLDATPEAGTDGTMLDHTLMLYMSDNGEKHHSKAEEWPMLLMGGSELGFNTDGRSVVYPRYGNDNNRQVSNMFNSLGYSAGHDLDDFGAEGRTRIAEGPLSEVWSV